MCVCECVFFLDDWTVLQMLFALCHLLDFRLLYFSDYISSIRVAHAHTFSNPAIANGDREGKGSIHLDISVHISVCVSVTS